MPDGGGLWDDLPAPRDEDAPPGDGPDTEPSPGCPGPADDDGGSEPGLEPTDGGNPGVTAPGGGPWDDLPAPRDEDAPADDGLGDDGLDAGPDEGWDPAGDDDDLCGAGPVPAWPALGAIPPALARQSAAPPRGRPAGGLLDVLLPWTTLAGLAERPGTLGRIGPVTAVQARLLAQAAGHDPAAAWRAPCGRGPGWPAASP